MKEQKRISARFLPKGDIEANLKRATGFVPLDKEIIIYKPDDKYDYARIKIGNGVDTVTDLPFIAARSIIEVAELPNPCLDNSVFYRKIIPGSINTILKNEDGSVERNTIGGAQVDVFMVDTLPAEGGKPGADFTPDGMPVQWNFYYQKNDGQFYLWMTPELSPDLTEPTWITLEALGMGSQLIISESEATELNVLYVYESAPISDKTLYYYIDEWIPIRMSDYNELENLPSINGVELKGNVEITLQDLGYAIDNELNEASENPVQNKVISQAFSEVSSTLGSFADVAKSGDYTDLKNSPIGERNSLVTITYPAENTGTDITVNLGNTPVFFRLASSMTPASDKLVGCTAVVYDTYCGEHTVILEEPIHANELGATFLCSSGYIVVVYNSGYSYNDFKESYNGVEAKFDTPGIYLSYISQRDGFIVRTLDIMVTEVKKLDNKYLDLANNSELSQIINETYLQVDFNETDLSKKSGLLNKPFGEIYEPNVWQLDLNAEHYNFMYKVSDKIYSTEDVLAGTFVIDMRWLEDTSDPTSGMVASMTVPISDCTIIKDNADYTIMTYTEQLSGQGSATSYIAIVRYADHEVIPDIYAPGYGEARIRNTGIFVSAFVTSDDVYEKISSINLPPYTYTKLLDNKYLDLSNNDDFKDLSDKITAVDTTSQELSLRISNLANVAQSGEYSDLINAPTKLSDFDNDLTTDAIFDIDSLTSKRSIPVTAVDGWADTVVYLQSGSYTFTTDLEADNITIGIENLDNSDIWFDGLNTLSADLIAGNYAIYAGIDSDIGLEDGLEFNIEYTKDLNKNVLYRLKSYDNSKTYFRYDGNISEAMFEGVPVATYIVDVLPAEGLLGFEFDELGNPIHLNIYYELSTSSGNIYITPELDPELTESMWISAEAMFGTSVRSILADSIIPEEFGVYITYELGDSLYQYNGQVFSPVGGNDTDERLDAIETQLGDIESVLDSILEMQNSLIGGNVE